MKITGTRSYILVEFDHRSIKITGELTTTPAFYADINSIKHWESPYDNIIITEEEKKLIIKRILQESEDKVFKIYFE